MKSHFSISQIVNIIETNQPVKDDWFTYKPAVKIFGLTIIDEHIKGFGLPDFCSVEKFNKLKNDSHYVQDGVIYEKINVVVRFTNNQSLTAHFDSIEEMEKYVSDLKNKEGRWIECNVKNV